jgi:autotransporter-associated beta strand protein
VNIGGIPSAGILLGAVNGSGGSIASLQTNIGTLANGTATFNQASGTHTTSNVLIGDNNGVTATYIMQGGTLTTTAIRFGNFSNTSETFNLDGGTVLTSIVEDNTAAGAGVFNFDGGTLKAAANSTNFISPIGAVDVLANGGSIGTQTYNVTISQPLIHAASLGATLDGGISKLGAGTLTYAAVNTYTGPTNVTLGTLEVANTGAIAGPINVSNGSVNYDASAGGGILHQTTGAISLTGASTKFTLATAGSGSLRMLLTTPSISVGPADKFDLTNNDLDITGQTLASVNTLVTTGFQNNFNAAGGITSSTAQSDATHLHAIGVIQNNQSGNSVYTVLHLYDGIAPGPADVLAKYTYFGDANLDGQVDGSDYTLIDAGFNSQKTAAPLTGWYNGDFNYDGQIDGSDYTLIDNAFNTQGANVNNAVQFASTTDQIASGGSVPEPAAFAITTTVLLAFSSRRRWRPVRLKNPS